MDNDFGRPVNLITAPVTFGRRRTGKKIGQPLRAGSEFLPKIRAATGWTPRITLSEGLASTLAYYRAHFERYAGEPEPQGTA